MDFRTLQRKRQNQLAQLTKFKNNLDPTKEFTAISLERLYQ